LASWQPFFTPENAEHWGRLGKIARHCPTLPDIGYFRDCPLFFLLTVLFPDFSGHLRFED
jgi:hypothetical protein